ncbi:hypothetical protein Ahy_A07g037264 isoform A [Arachis hypogaea]|uniref:Uncharacterized protein n=1 Tax=Arachis hypogaea TaxID=3818 RepID=A0A445CI85_ARAHY|nr:hypothetical protein Ahy_A07g037264 isoform A [Arachis hypogaea]
MAKSFAVAVILVAFCFSSSALARLVPEDDTFTVEGKVYCDPCHFEFETRLSHPLSNIKGQTDKNGFYSLPVKGDHQEEFCEVKTEKSTHAKCKEPMKKMDVDRIALTKNNGVSSSIRFINPLGFMTRNIDARCVSVAQELGMLVSLNDQHDN